jgi:hypothetical protein
MLEKILGIKKDKITKLIEKSEKSFYDDYKNNNLNFFEAHCKMQDGIEEIYKTNDFYYQELLDRKRFLTSFKSQTISLIIALAFGLLSTWIYELITTLSRMLYSSNPILNLILQIIMLIITLIIIIMVVRKVFKTAKFISNLDTYNTNDFELLIIEEKLNLLDKKQL